jgi:hypothetical protein
MAAVGSGEAKGDAVPPIGVGENMGNSDSNVGSVVALVDDIDGSMEDVGLAVEDNGKESTGGNEAVGSSVNSVGDAVIVGNGVTVGNIEKVGSDVGLSSDRGKIEAP